MQNKKHISARLLLGCAAACAGCAAPLAPIPASAHYVAGVPASIRTVQSSPEFKTADRLYKAGHRREAAATLDRLARFGRLTAEESVFCQAQRDLCLSSGNSAPRAEALVPPADCGPASLVFACRALGLAEDLDTARRLSGAGAGGASMAGLQRAAEAAGLRAEGVQVNEFALARAKMPAVAWVTGDHFIAVLKVSGGADGAVTIRDPRSAGEEKIGSGQFMELSRGNLLLLSRPG